MADFCMPPSGLEYHPLQGAAVWASRPSME
jgi:hypothetical protein